MRELYYTVEDVLVNPKANDQEAILVVGVWDEFTDTFIEAFEMSIPIRVWVYRMDVESGIMQDDLFIESQWVPKYFDKDLVDYKLEQALIEWYEEEYNRDDNI